MNLPQEFPEIVAAAIRALQVIEMQARSQAARHPESPVRWLTIRDVAGLALRLEAMTEWEWRSGCATLFITGQDLGVLDELLSSAEGVSSLDTMAGSLEGRASLLQLRTFLGSYCGGAFKFDDPAAAGPPSGAPAA